MNGIQHGPGKLTYADGRHVTSTWVGGSRTGKSTFNNGDTYEGEWWDGRMHGTGRLTYAATGKTVAGQFTNGQYTPTMGDRFRSLFA